MSTNVDHYLAAERENTQRSYRSALRHFEQSWGGLLPASEEMVARYLADHAETLSISTLCQRLAALARWHAEHGFVDPTRAPRVWQVLKGIRSLHATPPRQAQPLALETVTRLLQTEEDCAILSNRPGEALRAARDRALFLVGFWRGFRSDELARLRIEHIEVTEGQGMRIFLAQSKGDRENVGRQYDCPALSRCCPVAAYTHWLDVSGLVEGPAFRKIDRHGVVQAGALHPGSLAPLLRGRLEKAGLLGNRKEGEFSSHSLRRGLANWARDSGWDVKALMAYVGWKDMRSALRYLEDDPVRLQDRFERGL